MPSLPEAVPPRVLVHVGGYVLLPVRYHNIASRSRTAESRCSLSHTNSTDEQCRRYKARRKILIAPFISPAESLGQLNPPPKCAGIVLHKIRTTDCSRLARQSLQLVIAVYNSLLPPLSRLLTQERFHFRCRVTCAFRHKLASFQPRGHGYRSSGNSSPYL